MSADFWAGYISGAAGILIGNPLDVVKVRLQTGQHPSAPLAARHQFPSTASLLAGTAAPVLGYGALNALLFVSYRSAEEALNRHVLRPLPDGATGLSTVWLAGAAGGLAAWVISTPTELIKCRAQLAPAESSPSPSSWTVARQVWRAEGLRGFYLGGAVTAVRDSVGYGFYFWVYELTTRWWTLASAEQPPPPQLWTGEAAKVLLCGGLAGVATWASIFPLDVIKTRVQTQQQQVLGTTPGTCRTPLLSARRIGAIETARQAYREGGLGVFFRGLTVCSIRAFIVNAVQWSVYEWVMHELVHGRPRGTEDA